MRGRIGAGARFPALRVGRRLAWGVQGRGAWPQCKWGRHCCRPHSHQRVDILIFARLLADLPPRAFQGILGARCLALFAQSFDLRLATGAAEFRHRRSRRHPALASALLRFSEARSLRCSLPCAVAWPRPRFFTDPVRCGWGLSPFRCASVSARLPGLSDETASRPSQTSPLAFGQSLLQAVSR